MYSRGKATRQSYEQKTPPVNEPLELAQVRNYLKRDAEEDDGVDDGLLTSLITVARRQAEKYTGRSLITQSWTLWRDYFPGHMRYGGEYWWDGVRDGAISELYATNNELRLNHGPLQSVTHIKTYDDADTEKTFDAANYYVDKSGNRIVLRRGATWPVALRTANAIEVEFVAGYGLEAADIPDPIVQGMLRAIAYWEENRGEVLAQGFGQAITVPAESQMMWVNYATQSIDTRII